MWVQGTRYRSVWLEGSTVRLIEQRLLPHRFEIASCRTSEETANAIRTMAVRGAGAIGAAAGFAMAQGALEAPDEGYRPSLDRVAERIRATRPTAHDLFAAVRQVHEAAISVAPPAAGRQAAVAAAEGFAEANAQAGEAIGRAGLPLLRQGARMLTHCNAGWLAFVDWGSALAPVYRAHMEGRAIFVYTTETRPRSQGAKLTAWELTQAGVPHRLIADTAAGQLFRRGLIDLVIVGADRIAANGDVANKVGTYTLAVLARQHQVPFYVAAPRSTFDPATPTGEQIVIEQRSEDEVLCVEGLSDDSVVRRVRIAGAGTAAENPAFDVTPADLMTGFITEAGLIEPARQAIAAFLEAPQAAPAR